ncbi:MAG: T9SS type A sorting domain-containing protein [Chlorobi bacterium]|nr:T9SS type A sorting domain-containing protein [Chlorobiota bacterium]
MSKGSNYSITIYPAWSGTVYSEGYSVWIDYNQDGDFDDAGEQVYTQAKTTATSINGSFTVPTSALSGSTRMRVSMQYNAIPVPCGNFDYGEVEDYTVNIGAKSYTPTNNDLYIYPNPAENIITVYLKGLHKTTNVQIFSITGSIVKEIKMSDLDNKINISDLPAGIYNIRTIYNGNIYNGKFIKQ